jgi:hypothetical protein
MPALTQNTLPTPASNRSKSGLVRVSLASMLLFLLYEGFYLLPERWVVLIPGVLRLADVFFLIFPVFFIMYINGNIQTLLNYKDASILIFSACTLMLISALMATLFFDQPYLTGLLLVRHNFFYLSFFIFVILLRNLVHIENFISFFTIIVGIYLIILLLTDYFPDMGIIQFRKSFYEKTENILRFGEKRLFFPYGDVPIFLYCLIIARLIYPKTTESRITKTLYFIFILIAFYAVLSTYTRSLVFSLLAVTAFALFATKRRNLRYIALVLVVLIVSGQALSSAITESGLSFIKESKLGKMMYQSEKLQPERGRYFQFTMYMNNFMRSPLTGVGTLANERHKGTFLDIDLQRTYRKYRFFNAVDLGYAKILAEYGILGVAWIVWYYCFIYRQSKQIMALRINYENSLEGGRLARGHLYFMIYLLISSITLPHFIHRDAIPIIALSIALMAVTHKSLALNVRGEKMAVDSKNWTVW